jgi:hypothetical protein
MQSACQPFEFKRYLLGFVRAKIYADEIELIKVMNKCAFNYDVRNLNACIGL